MTPRQLVLIGSIAGIGASPALLACREDGAARAEAPPTSMVRAMQPQHTDNPPELGLIAWQRDYSAGLAAAAESGKPVLLLFDEVPGCSTVNAFGREVLSHPLVVDAAESAFVPVAVYNNAGGADRRVLERWGEPSWNNPVLRFITSDEREVAPRLTHAGGVAGVLRAMVTALEGAGRPVPEWLALAAAEAHTQE